MFEIFILIQGKMSPRYKVATGAIFSIIIIRVCGWTLKMNPNTLLGANTLLGHPKIGY